MPSAPLLWGLCVFLVAQGICQSSIAGGHWDWVVLAAAVFLVVSPTRIVRRSDRHLDLLSARGRKHFVADDYLVHVETDQAGRFSAVRWRLACRASSDRSFAMGFLSVGARRSVHTTKATLGLPLSLETEAWLNQAAGTVPPSKRQLITLGVLMAVAIVLLIASLAGDATGDLRLECNPGEVLRLSGGYGTVHGGRTLAIRPGRYGVERWLPERACWIRRDLTIVGGAATVVRCTELATTEECITGRTTSLAH